MFRDMSRRKTQLKINNFFIPWASASQPFFNHGTLTWNHSPDGTLHCWHLFYI